MVFTIFLAAWSFSLSSAAIRKPLTTSLISLTISFTMKHRSMVPVGVVLLLVSLPLWPMIYLPQASMFVDKFSIIWLLATVTHSSKAVSLLSSRKVSLHIFFVYWLRVVTSTSLSSFRPQNCVGYASRGILLRVLMSLASIELISDPNLLIIAHSCALTSLEVQARSILLLAAIFFLSLSLLVHSGHYNRVGNGFDLDC